MNIDQLWDKLALPSGKLTGFRKDISEGKVPELPYYIVGQDALKKVVKERLEVIDSSRMITNLIIAKYGNGKTNLLKYLQLFFKTYSEFKIQVQYSRADVERTDLVLFLLKILQDQYLEEIVRIIVKIRANPDIIPKLVNDYNSNFREIKSYCEKLFEPSNSEETIIEILYLGTGRFYNKRYFDNHKLEQLKDFNRREILVLFLNILSHDSNYVVFAIDEVEKIREKSKIRFSHFLTSYRELVDLFNQVNGHYLIVSLTTASGAQEISTANDALYSRINGDIIQIEPLAKKKEMLELIDYLNDLFQTEKSSTDIYSQILRKNTPNNREAIQEISKLLYVKEAVAPLHELLETAELSVLYVDTEEKLENDDAFKNLHRKFFDPLEYYVEALGLTKGLNKQERTFVDEVTERVHYFIFNTYLEDFENEKTKIEKLISLYPHFNIIVYSPVTLELTHTKLDLSEDERVEIIDIEPKDLFILLEMYRDNYDLQPQLTEIISNYTKHKL
ncbi:hypothetical protein [Fluviicola taffensis]|uniref:hypothetical protein n=1 Tax=Fluviicola taffensis TaxID=191579 RepID=UPI0031381968